MVDYVAILYGDPLMSLDFHDFEPTPREAFLKGYGKNYITEHEKMRIQIYRVWHRLGMVVERAYRQYEKEDTFEWVLGEFEKEVKELETM